ncbi:unnamed protein product [Linum trigynum]|uniref:Uncharacterized protein n=2 Tax=Linum trigynum TaxID=586398 RepID=A0AAV2EKU5_9ROSI
MLCIYNLQLTQTHHFFHSKKGVPFADYQGICNWLTRLVQIENGKQLTCNRNFIAPLCELCCASSLQIGSLMHAFDSVKSALRVLEESVALNCEEETTKSCIQYLEAVPWDDSEEEEIVKVASRLGPIAMPIVARISPVDLTATRNVFLSALRFATSSPGGEGSGLPFGDELRTSAQEQIEYMLGEDEETPLVTADDEVRSVARAGLAQIFSSFQTIISCSLSETTETEALHIVSDLVWMCNVLPKMDMMKDFVVRWTEASIVEIIEDNRFESIVWGLKVKVIEVTVKVLEAVGYGTVILQPTLRVQLLRTWLPYIRKLKPILDAKAEQDPSFGHRMDEDLCQNIEGAIVSLILALPSNDQGEILAGWMSGEQVKFPDLSEAFEVWCYRTKSAKRRLVEGGLDRVGNGNGRIETTEMRDMTMIPSAMVLIADTDRKESLAVKGSRK